MKKLKNPSMNLCGNYRVEWFVKMVEERKHQHDSSKEKRDWL